MQPINEYCIVEDLNVFSMFIRLGISIVLIIIYFVCDRICRNCAALFLNKSKELPVRGLLVSLFLLEWSHSNLLILFYRPPSHSVEREAIDSTIYDARDLKEKSRGFVQFFVGLLFTSLHRMIRCNVCFHCWHKELIPN